jgi:hypothetical protein
MGHWLEGGTDSDGETYSGEDVELKRRVYAHRWRNLQRKAP